MAAGRATAGMLLVALAAFLLLPGASAAGGLLVSMPSGTMEVESARDITIPIELHNVRAEANVFVGVNVDAPARWRVVVTEPFVEIPPQSTHVVGVTLTPPGGLRDALTRSVTFAVNVVDTDTGAETTITRTIHFRVLAEPLIFNVLPNPLPHPFDAHFGVFLVELAIWILVALTALFAGDVIVRILTRRANADVTRAILTKYRTPVFLLVILVGVSSSLTLLPRDFTGIVVLERFLNIVVVFTALYLLYQVIDSVLLYYIRQIAPRTATKVDDVLVPVLRKVVAVVIVIVALAQVFRLFGLDPTVLIAGAGIAGIAIAFAAQETISNFFSGIFLLVDRPFVEGDDIILESGEVVRVEDVGLRSTRFYHYRNHEVFILPNRKIADSRITNLVRPDRQYRIMIEVGVAYGTPVEKVREALLAAAHRHPQVLRGEGVDPIVLFANFGNSSLDFVLRCAVEELRFRFLTMSEIRGFIVEEFAARGIEVPFPQRTLWLGRKGDEARLEAALAQRRPPDRDEGSPAP